MSSLPRLAPGLERLSLNTATVRAGLLETVEACVRVGVPWIAPWRHQLEEVSTERAARAIRPSPRQSRPRRGSPMTTRSAASARAMIASRGASVVSTATS